MQNALLVGLSRQVALARELDVVANNIANLNTTGFKADGSLFEEYLSPAARADQTGSRVSFVRDRGTWHDMSQGAIEHTGNPLDVAIDGNGFLVVQTPRGERYTRNGALQINADRPTRHQRRLSGARRRRSDHVPAHRPAGLDQPRRHASACAKAPRQRRFGARQASRWSRFAEPQRLQKDGNGTFNADRRRAAATGDDGRVSSRARLRNPTCAASSR